MLPMTHQLVRQVRCNVIATIGGLIFAAVCAYGNAIDPTVRARLQQTVDSVLRAEDIQGVSAAVLLEGDVWVGAAGTSYVGRPITPEMVFGIGSNTKTCTALTLLRLQEQGLLRLDAAIGQWIPTHPHIDSAITVRQLLQHTSGIGDFSALRAYRDACLADPSRVWKASELMALIPEREFERGTSWMYCNTNYFLAGVIAESVTGFQLQNLYRRELCELLDLDSTRLVPQDSVVGELAHRWMGGRDASSTPMSAEWSGAGAAGAIVSTASEMVQLYDALFRSKVLTQESLQQLTDFEGPNQYGLGISRKTIAGEPVIGHSGEIRGYSSLVFWIPSLQASVAVLTNSIPSNPLAVAAAIIRVLRDRTTSVDPDGSASCVFFPVAVHDLAGRIVLHAEDAHSLTGLLPGVYTLIGATRSWLICVNADNTVGVCKSFVVSASTSIE